MAGFLYYIEGATQDVKIADLRRFGLGHAFDNDGDFTASGVTRGPGAPGSSDAGPGIVVATMSRLGERALGLYPDEQTWRIILGTGDQKVMVGHYKDDPPRPVDLARTTQLPGHPVVLADGQTWLIPIARAVAEQQGQLQLVQNLPQRTTLDDKGDWVRDGVIPKYARLWEIANQWWDQVIAALNDTDLPDSGESQISFEFAGRNDAAVAALSANHAIGKFETAMLELFDDQCAGLILSALIDIPSINMFLKKKLDAAEPATSPIGDGASAETQTTTPA